MKGSCEPPTPKGCNPQVDKNCSNLSCGRSHVYPCRLFIRPPISLMQALWLWPSHQPTLRFPLPNTIFVGVRTSTHKLGQNIRGQNGFSKISGYNCSFSPMFLVGSGLILKWPMGTQVFAYWVPRRWHCFGRLGGLDGWHGPLESSPQRLCPFSALALTALLPVITYLSGPVALPFLLWWTQPKSVFSALSYLC